MDPSNLGSGKGSSDKPDGDNGRGNDAGGVAPSNLGSDRGSFDKSDGDNGQGNDAGGFDPSNPGQGSATDGSDRSGGRSNAKD